MDVNATVRTSAKWLARAVVAIKTEQVAADFAAEHTRFGKDDMIVKLGAGAAAAIVSTNLAPVTDTIVDKSADFIVEKYNKRRAKRDAKKQEK